MPTRSQVTSQARALIGMGENPPGSNRNKITSTYGLVGPWCAMTTWYVWHLLGVDLRALYTTGWALCTSGANAAKTRGDWVAGLSGAQPGDLVYFKVPGGDPGYVNHTGIYVSSDANTCVTIDGNWDNKLQQVSHPRSIVVGHINMSRHVTAPKPAPPKPKPAAKAPAYPGRSAFGPGKHGDYITAMGKQLVKKGYGHHYKVGPGPTWTEADRLNVQSFQLAQGWHGTEKGGDADGYPGPVTWSRLFS